MECRLQDVFRGGLQAVGPLDEADAIFTAEPFFALIQAPSLFQRLLSAKEGNRAVVLNPLVLQGSPEGGDVEVKALPAKPGRAVLVERIRIQGSHGLKEGELVLPL